ncbi:MAG: MFS transporter [Aggregatilineales bacterium]
MFTNASSTLLQSRRTVLAMFFVNGAVLFNWTTRIPQIKENLELSDGDLGRVLLGIAVGVLFALPLAGGMIARYSSRTVTIFSAFGMMIAFPLLALAPSPILLWLALFLFGAMTSSMDMGMNAQAVEIERRKGRPIMSSFHAAFSLGGFFGALMTNRLTAMGLEPLTHFLIASVFFSFVILYFIRHLVNIDGEVAAGGAVFRLPQRALWALGAIAFCAAIGEGAIADWSAVYLTDIVGTLDSVAALGAASFSLMMTVGRLSGDWLAEKYSPATIVRVGGVIGAVGLALVLIAPSTVTALIGFGAVGAGLSTIIPLAFSAAGNMPGLGSGAGIAGVATIGYSGFLAGPPVIGQIAEFTSLRVALVIVVILIGALFFLADAVQVKAPKADAKPAESVG